jgi:hypothetical protein
MVPRAFWGASGKIWSRTSPRAEGAAVDNAVDEVLDEAVDDAGALGAFADENVPVRTEAGVGATGGGSWGAGAVFFSAGAFNVFCGPDGFGDGGVARRAGGSTAFGGAAAAGAEAVEAEEEESERWPRIFGSAKMATITRRTAATGTT